MPWKLDTILMTLEELRNQMDVLEKISLEGSIEDKTREKEDQKKAIISKKELDLN